MMHLSTSSQCCSSFTSITVQTKTDTRDPRSWTQAVSRHENECVVSNFSTLEPSDYWSKVSAPVLILNGDKDVQVSADINTKAIQDAAI